MERITKKAVEIARESMEDATNIRDRIYLNVPGYSLKTSYEEFQIYSRRKRTQVRGGRHGPTEIL